MSYPKTLGDKQIFKEDFTSTKSVVDNGGVLTNATVSNGVMTCVGGGVGYKDVNLDAFVSTETWTDRQVAFWHEKIIKELNN